MRTDPLCLTAPLLVAALAASAHAQSPAGPTFGHARTRDLAELGVLPVVRDVVVRDIVNYRTHLLPLPRADREVALDVRFDRSSAGDSDMVVLQVGYTTRPEGDRALAAPASVALVVDCSGSMQERGKMDQVKRGLREFVRHLRDDDEVALISFSTEARVVATRRARGDGRWLQSAIDELQPAGNTNLHAGLMLGLRELQQEDTGRRSQRLVLLTDGIANTGVTDPAQILADTAPFTRAAIDISTIGVGQNLDVPLLERLARGTRGVFHFVADDQDVQAVFVQEIAGLLKPVARRPRLEITLGRDLQVEHVFHEGAQREGDRIVVELPDFNAGVTGVVIARCRIFGGTDPDLTARAELAYEGATTGRRGTERASAELRLRGDRRAEFDLEVVKNHAIAVLAQGLRDMAEASEGKRWADADRCLRRARDEAQRIFPGDDADLQRVREIVAGHARTLQRYVDRFRDY